MSQRTRVLRAVLVITVLLGGIDGFLLRLGIGSAPGIRYGIGVTGLAVSVLALVGFVWSWWRDQRAAAD